MKIEFWLLDLNYERENGKPRIWLWGIARDQKRVLIIDEYQPYFYLLPREGQDPALVKKNLEIETPHPSTDGISLEKRMRLADERLVLRISCRDADSVEKCARQVSRRGEVEGVYEHDIRPATKYQNDYEVRPCRWYEIDVEEMGLPTTHYGVENVYRAASHPLPTQKEDHPQLRVMAFSTLAVSEAGSPSPYREPIRMIALRTNDGKLTVLESKNDDDRIVLEEFAREVSVADPDVLFSFGGNESQWPFLVKRAERAEIILSIGRGGVPPHQSLYGHFSVTGRANIDLSDFVEDLYDVKEKSLVSLAGYLGVAPKAPSSIDETEYFSFWSDLERRKVLRDWLGSQADTVLDVGTDVLDYMLQLSALSGLPPDQVLAAAVGFRVDSYVMLEAHRLGQLIPSRSEQPIIPYKGAIVLQPLLGLHDNVAALDFSSMYPSLMIKFNVSPDTYVKYGKEDDVFVVPEVGHRFRKHPRGFYSSILAGLIQSRRAIKLELSKVQRGTLKYRLLKARERATKLITNATYGYAGWAGSRWYSREVAESAAALGRDTIQRAISIAKRMGLKVLYGDTDSLFVEYEREKVTGFLTTIEVELGLDIALSRVYRRIMFTEAKKKYSGLDEKGELDVVGMEAIRGDWSALAKQVQNTVLRMVLEDANPARASSYVSDLVRGLESAKLPLSSFIIWKTMTKPPDRYDVHAPHVEAAKKLQKAGWSVSSGDSIGYVIVKGHGKLFQRAEPYFKVSPSDIDYDYYVQNQVLPVAARVLSIFGLDESALLPRDGQKALSTRSE